MAGDQSTQPGHPATPIAAASDATSTGGATDAAGLFNGAEVAAQAPRDGAAPPPCIDDGAARRCNPPAPRPSPPVTEVRGHVVVSDATADGLVVVIAPDGDAHVVDGWRGVFVSADRDLAGSEFAVEGPTGNGRYVRARLRGRGKVLPSSTVRLFAPTER